MPSYPAPSPQRPPSRRITYEQLAYWYLRLNGFLTIPNFIVHPDQGTEQATDVDVLGVRFPHRSENLLRPMEDDTLLSSLSEAKPFVCIAEVKASECSINGPWTHPNRPNLLRVLRAVGTFDEIESVAASENLRSNGFYSNSEYYVSLVCFGSRTSTTVLDQFPSVPQLIWSEVLTFIFGRFSSYRREKSSHPQWDPAGHLLWSQFQNSLRGDPDVRVQNFIQRIEPLLTA